MVNSSLTRVRSVNTRARVSDTNEQQYSKAPVAVAGRATNRVPRSGYALTSTLTLTLTLTPQGLPYLILILALAPALALACNYYP